MAWGRLDDGFDDHPKTVAILEHDIGLTAIGLWTLCFTWAHRNTRKPGKVPGLIPFALPRRYAGLDARALADVLVKEDLWEVRAEGDGWMIHDFDQYLPTDALRQARAEAGRRGAEARWGKDKPPGPDGKLPSPDSKLPSGAMALPMANDGKTGREPGPPPGGASGGPEHGNEPSPDSNQPSPHGNLPSGAMAKNAPYPYPDPYKEQAPTVPAADNPPLTDTQRSKRLTDAYAKAEPMCKWPAVNGIVLKAIKAGKFSDEEIRGALLRLAAEGRSVTVDTLRTELRGLPPRTSSRQNETDALFERAARRIANRKGTAP